MTDPDNQIHDLEELVSYCESHAGSVVYIDNDSINIYDPDNEDIWMDLHPNYVIHQALRLLGLNVEDV